MTAENAGEAESERDSRSLDDASWLEEAFARHLTYGLFLACVFSLCLWGLLGLLAANLP
jgi:hypothetical protein